MPLRLMGQNMERGRGQVVPLIALAMVAILGCASLAIDIGFWRAQQRYQQSAADAAAVAGAIDLNYSNTSSVIAGVVASSATSNGFTNSAISDPNSIGYIKVDPHYPPTISAKYAGNTSTVEVVISKTHAAFFGRIFGRNSTLVTARGVARVTFTTGACLYTLSQSATAITLKSGNIVAPTCGVIDNGGFNPTNKTIDSASSNGAGILPPLSDTANFTSFPKQIVPIADPCSAISGCKKLQLATYPTATPCSAVTGATLTPGVHYCDTKLTGGQAITVLNSPVDTPVYIDNLTLGGGSSITGTGTLYMNTTGLIDFQGGSFGVAAPTSGLYSGIALYAPNATGVKLNGTAGTVGSIVGGLLYTPKADCTTDGTPTLSYGVVCSTLTVDGNKDFNLSNTGAPSIGHVSLVE